MPTPNAIQVLFPATPVTPNPEWPQNGVAVGYARVYFLTGDYGAAQNGVEVVARVCDAGTQTPKTSASIAGQTQVKLAEVGMTTDLTIGETTLRGALALNLFSDDEKRRHRVQIGELAPFYIDVAAGGGLAEAMRVPVP